MALVFAAITPHPPFLLPSIGKEAFYELKKTVKALQTLEEELYTAKPNLILIISPHTGLFAESFTINAHPTLTSAFEQFGDMLTVKTWTGAPEFAAKVSHAAKSLHLPVQLMSEEKIDHGATIPLTYLTEHLPQVKIVPIGYSALTPEDHVTFGKFLKEQIMESGKRVAVIASGDMSHCLTKDAPHGLKPAGEAFDKALQQAFKVHDTSSLSTLDAGLVQDAEECSYRSSLILMGILDGMNYTYVQHAYEHPFGVGYLTAQCVLS